jgi:hypothetical protein
VTVPDGVPLASRFHEQTVMSVGLNMLFWKSRSWDFQHAWFDKKPAKFQARYSRTSISGRFHVRSDWQIVKTTSGIFLKAGALQVFNSQTGVSKGGGAEHPRL